MKHLAFWEMIITLQSIKDFAKYVLPWSFLSSWGIIDLSRSAGWFSREMGLQQVITRLSTLIVLLTVNRVNTAYSCRYFCAFILAKLCKLCHIGWIILVNSNFQVLQKILNQIKILTKSNIFGFLVLNHSSVTKCVRLLSCWKLA